MARGASVRDCYDSLTARQNAMFNEVRRLYHQTLAGVADWHDCDAQKAIEEGTAPDSVVQRLDEAAIAALRALDPDLLTQSEMETARISPLGTLWFVGRIPWFVQLDHAPPLPVPPDTRTPEERAFATVERIARQFRTNAPVAGFFQRRRNGDGGFGRAASGLSAETMIAEVESLRANPQFEPTKLGKTQIDDILDPGGVTRSDSLEGLRPPPTPWAKGRAPGRYRQ